METFHDKFSGSKKGKNTVYNFSNDGINICHLGDLGHVLSNRQIQEIGNVDILLLPVGGRLTIGASDAVQVMKQLNPAIVIPMHYRTKAFGLLGFFFETVNRFISRSGLKVKKCNQLEINQETIKEYGKNKELVVLEYTWANITE